MLHSDLLWIIRFSTQAAPAELNVLIRTEIVPPVAGRSDVAAMFAACRAGEGEWQYALSAVAAPSAEDFLAEVARCLAERSPVPLSPIESRAEPVLASVQFDCSEEEAHLLRIFEGKVREGMLEEYVAAARQGTIDDAGQGRGPLALFLGSGSPERFLTVSVWPDWSRIEAATGGDVSHPIASKRHSGLVDGAASHYELIVEPKYGALAATATGDAR